MNVSLSATFAKARAENRAVLIGYIPAGFPTKERAVSAIEAMISGGVDIIEVGLPYSDPIMDGPVIQRAAEISLSNGTSVVDVIETVSRISAPRLIMSYWNPIERFGVASFTQSLAKAGGVGVITPDLTIEESEEWLALMSKHDLGQVFVVAPSSSDARLKEVVERCTGFIYAASLMGVTGVRSAMSNQAATLVERVKRITDTPVCVGLGVSTGAQAKEIASFADGVIVGSAFIKLILDSQDEAEANSRVKELALELAEAVRR